MKNQYYGDISDYRKYGLLRHLRPAASIGITWFLTADDDRSDGRHIDYLGQPGKYRHHDPELFDHLVATWTKRSIAEITPLLEAKQHDQIIADETDRAAYVESILGSLADTDLIFCNPDNGFGVKSVPLGKKTSCKYIYWHEFETLYQAGHSLLIYQHYARISRDKYRKQLIERAKETTEHVAIIATNRVAFLLAARPQHADALFARLDSLGQQWAGQLSVVIDD